MKELTYEDWQKNPTPRIMWVWDNNENNKKQLKVIYISKEDITHPVIALSYSDIDSSRYKHCAEIEEPKTRRMTNKELSRWLREKPTREYKHCNSSNGNFVQCFHVYLEKYADKEIYKDLVIREDDGEWREPLVEEVENDKDMY